MEMRMIQIVIKLQGK